MAYTKVSLKPLQKIEQLKHLGSANQAEYESVGDMVTFMFRLDDKEGEEVLQDLSIVFENKPIVYISEPYTYGNAGTADKQCTEEEHRHREQLLMQQDELMLRYREIEEFAGTTEYDNVRQACQNLMNELDQQAENIRRKLECEGI